MIKVPLLGEFRRSRIALTVLFVCLVPVLVGWYGLRSQEEKVGREQFELQAQEIVGLIMARMRQHEQILLGGAGVFDASTAVSRDEWKTYVSRLQLSENYPGIQGVGFSQVIPPVDLKNHVARVRAEGFPEYSLRPAGERPLYTSIVYLEPFSGRNLAAFGFDMFSEPTRRAAMTLAAESGRTAISGKVKLVQETHGKQQAGFLMYVPIYRKGVLPDSVEARWHNLRGFVYSPYRMGDLMQGIVGAHTFGIEFSIHDGSEANQDALMYSSAAVDEGQVARKPKYSALHQIEIFSHGWTINLYSTPTFEAKHNSDYEWLLLFLGCGVALLLFALTWFLINRREHALQLAQAMTEQIHSNEEALQESVQHIQAILDNMVDGIITIDGKGRVASFSKAAERIFGYTSIEVIGHNVKMLMPEPYHSAHDSYLQNYHATGIPRIIGIGREVQGKRRDGSVFPMDLAVSEIRRQGEPLYIGMVRDITERKRVERMKNEFVSTVSHELRTPLTSISGALGLIAGGALGELPQQAREMIAIAHKNSQRLTHLINDLLDMEKISVGKLHFEMKPQALMPLLRQTLDANRAYGTERGVGIELIGDVADMEVKVDSQRLMQILSNLLSNAIKFSPERGMVQLAVAGGDKLVRVTVIDHGPGIPAEFHGRIFQKFAQADSSDTRKLGGTGLGLAITKELVEHMGGRIGFESVEGAGASFYFDLPVWHAQTQEAGVNFQFPVGTDALHVLVVEDDADVARLLQMMLNRAGYAAEIAVNGAQALAALQRNRYSAITLDLMLPDMDGLEIIRLMRQEPETANVPIIVISAKMEDGRLAISGDFSAIDWLGKPVDDKKLLAVMERLVGNLSQFHPRVLHVEDDRDLHQVVRAMVGERFDFELATTLHEARARVELERFDVVILDLSLPDGSGWDLLPTIRERQPQARVVILTGTEMTAEQAHKVEAVLLKAHISPQQLIEAINSRIRSNIDKGATS